MKGAFFFMACLLTGLLSACGGEIHGQAGNDFVKITSFYDYGASGRDLLLIVDGNPYPGTPDFAKTVERAVQVQVNRPRTHPALVPDASARPGYSLVFVFQPAKTLQGDGVCQGQRAHDHAGASSITVLGVFCVSGRALTEVEGDVDAVSADDPKLTSLLRHMVMALFRTDLADSGEAGSGH